MRKRIFTLLAALCLLLCLLPTAAFASQTGGKTDESRSYNFDLSVGGAYEVRATTGETITVTGLLTGGDILAALTPEVCEGMKEIMLCSVTLRHEQDRFLDDMTIDEFRRRAPLPVRLVDCDGQSLYDGLHGRGLD